ncbi:MAG: universal stress protein [Gammaproteobacteria bacterium]|nr:universal stress protein [Gammaproteobacteria bacterium]
MSSYTNILLTVDFSQTSDRVIERAETLATHNSCPLSLIHVVDYIPLTGTEFGEMVPFSYDASDELLKASRERLTRLGETLSIPESRQYLEVGGVRSEVIRVAKAMNADLIVIGSHGWKGLELLLGSTADAILHHAPCDVFVVRALPVETA